jgi:hypothetical protein
MREMLTRFANTCSSFMAHRLHGPRRVWPARSRLRYPHASSATRL